MATQEINRYIAVASKWEEQYSIARTAVNIMQERVKAQETLIETLESQLKIQDNAIERKDAEIEKLKRFDKLYSVFCVLSGYVAGYFMGWWLL